MGAIELLPSVEQPVAHAPAATTNLILSAAKALGRLARIEAITAGKSVEYAQRSSRGVEVSRLALAIDGLLQKQQALMDALRHAEAWIEGAPHGDNCFVSAHYEGDPGDRCNCGKDAALQAVQEVIAAAGGAL